LLLQKACLSSGTEDPQIHIKVLRCFTSWVAIQAISLADMTDNIVIIHAFSILHNHQVRINTVINFRGSWFINKYPHSQCTLSFDNTKVCTLWLDILSKAYQAGVINLIHFHYLKKKNSIVFIMLLYDRMLIINDLNVFV
jgi:hypothetical protein